MVFIAYINIQHMLSKNVDKTRQKYRLRLREKAYQDLLLLQKGEKLEKKKQAAERRAMKKELRQIIRERMDEDMGLPEVYRPIVALEDFVKKYRESEERVMAALAEARE